MRAHQSDLGVGAGGSRDHRQTVPVGRFCLNSGLSHWAVGRVLEWG